MNSPIPASILDTAPERIWLDLGDEMHLIDPDTKFRDIGEVTWSHDNATGHGIEYVRASLSPVHGGAVPDYPLHEQHRDIGQPWQDVAVPSDIIGAARGMMGTSDEWQDRSLYRILQRALHGTPSAPAEPAPGAAPVQGEMDAEAYAELIRLRAAVKGPEGFATWQDAAVDERMQRIKAQRALAAQPAATQEPVEWEVRNTATGYRRVFETEGAARKEANQQNQEKYSDAVVAPVSAPTPESADAPSLRDVEARLDALAGALDLILSRRFYAAYTRCFGAARTQAGEKGSA